MLSYLLASGMQGAYDALSRETGLEDFDASDPKSKFNGLLEKKWTSVIRLQKKVRRFAQHSSCRCGVVFCVWCLGPRAE